jgi:hypothetical protein
MTASLRLALAATASLALAACSSSSPAPGAAAPAAALAYTDPVSTGWRLVRDGSSSPTRLVLNLVGPAGLRTRGVGMNLLAPPSIRFGFFPNRLPVADLGVYELLSAAADPAEPVAITGGVLPGNVLSVGIFQKGRERPAKDSGVPLCQVAVELDPGLGLRAGDAVDLRVVKARAIPEDIGQVTDDIHVLYQKVRMADVQVAVGALTAR